MSKTDEELRQEASVTVEDPRTALFRREAQVFEQIKAFSSTHEIPMGSRMGLLDKISTDVDTAQGAHYSDRSGLAVRPSGGLSLFARGTTADDPDYDAIKSIAEELGTDVAGLAGLLGAIKSFAKAVVTLDPQNPQTQGRIVAASKVMEGREDNYKVGDDGTPKLATKVTELTQQLADARNNQPTRTVNAHPLDGVRTKFDRFSDDEKMSVTRALDKIVSHPDAFVKPDGKIVGDDQVDYRTALNAILQNSEMQTFHVGGVFGAGGEDHTVRIVHAEKLDANLRGWLHWD